MCVVTAKPRVYASRIVEHFGIARLFRSVYGPELGARDYTKESLIRAACAGAKATANRAIMVGDRAEDVRGARSNGVGSVAAMASATSWRRLSRIASYRRPASYRNTCGTQRNVRRNRHVVGVEMVRC